MKPNDASMSAILIAATLPQRVCEDVLLEKHAKDGERSIDDVCRRVIKALARVEKPGSRERREECFDRAQVEAFIPGGRINSTAGPDFRETLVHCFVQPVSDSVSCEAGTAAIYNALQQATETMRRGRGHHG